jgi:hypothetical protein
VAAGKHSSEPFRCQTASSKWEEPGTHNGQGPGCGRTCAEGSWGRVGAAGALQWVRCACVEVEGSHVIIVSQPEAVTDLILKAVHAVSGAGRRLVRGAASLERLTTTPEDDDEHQDERVLRRPESRSAPAC